MKGIPYEHYKLKRNPFFPISLHEKNPDTRGYPRLFPDGKFGLHHERPTVSMGKGKGHTERDVARWQLKCTDRRFVDAGYLSFLHGFLEGKVLLSSLGLRARMAKGKLDTANFLEMLEEGSPEFQIGMSSIATALRGRDAYWVETRRILQSHISTFGPPTWFVTLNPAIDDWPELLQVYQNAYPKEKITTANMMDWIAKDPFFFARHFQSRLNNIMNEVVMKKGGPLGTIVHYFNRIEYQQRGLQHCHMLLWAKDSPSKEASDEEV